MWSPSTIPAAGAASSPALGLMGFQPGPPTEVDLLITGCDIVTFDKADRVVIDGAIAVQGNTIEWIGAASDAAGLYRAKQTINARGLIAMPGLTDTHYHTAQQFLRGVHKVSHKKGPDWKTYLIPFETGLEPEDVYSSGIAGYTSMISCGTTCFLDAGGTHPDEMGRAADEVGIRGRIALNTCDIDGPGGPLPKSHIMTTSQALKENEALVKRWQKNPRVNAWLSLRQILVNGRAASLYVASCRRARYHHPHPSLGGDRRGGLHHRKLPTSSSRLLRQDRDFQ
jgi:5-methylthioadenosine/S-adenosylhomocysteine deaminase